MTNITLIQKFVSGNTTGKNSNGSLFIGGDTLYSYGFHYPLVKRLKNGKFQINERKFSPSTSKHRSQVIREIINAKKSISSKPLIA